MDITKISDTHFQIQSVQAEPVTLSIDEAMSNLVRAKIKLGIAQNQVSMTQTDVDKWQGIIDQCKTLGIGSQA